MSNIKVTMRSGDVHIGTWAGTRKGKIILTDILDDMDVELDLKDVEAIGGIRNDNQNPRSTVPKNEYGL